MKLRTIDGVQDLTIRATRPALLDLCVVELKEIVKPSKQFCARLAHSRRGRVQEEMVEVRGERALAQAMVDRVRNSEEIRDKVLTKPFSQY